MRTVPNIRERISNVRRAGSERGQRREGYCTSVTLGYLTGEGLDGILRHLRDGEIIGDGTGCYDETPDP